MKTYNYLDFIELFQIKDRRRAEDKWVTFKVQESGVTLFPIHKLPNPAGGDLYSLEELFGREEKIPWHPLLEIRAQKTSFPPAPKALPPSKDNIEFIKKRIDQEITIPPSPPLLPSWARGLGDLRKPLLVFPCSEEELRSFIKCTQLEFMLPENHALLQTHTEGTYQTEISGASPSRENRPEDNSPVIAVGWRKKRKNKGELMYIEEATDMSQATVRKYAGMIEKDFLLNRTRKTSNGKTAIHLTQADVIRIIAAKNYFRDH